LIYTFIHIHIHIHIQIMETTTPRRNCASSFASGMRRLLFGEDAATAPASADKGPPCESERVSLKTEAAMPELGPNTSVHDSWLPQIPTLSSATTQPSFFDPSRSSGADGTSSMVASVLNVANAILGAGMLALPSAFAKTGVVAGVILVMLAAVLNLVTCLFISETVDAVGRPANFKKIADQALPGFSLVVDVGVVINVAASACSYFIVATDAFHSATGGGEGSRWVYTVATLAIVTPLSYLRSMDTLRFTSLAAVVIILFMAGLILLMAFRARDFEPCPDTTSPHCGEGEPVLATDALSILDAFGTLTLAYACQSTTPIIVSDMQRPTRGRIAATYALALGLAMSLYLAVGLAGYVTFGPEVDPDILNGYPNSPIVLAARLGIAVVVIFSFPMTVFAARISIGTLITTFASICGFSCTPPVDTPPSNACAKLFITEFRPMLTSARLGATPRSRIIGHLHASCHASLHTSPTSLGPLHRSNLPCGAACHRSRSDRGTRWCERGNDRRLHRPKRVLYSHPKDGAVAATACPRPLYIPRRLWCRNDVHRHLAGSVLIVALRSD